MQTTETRESVQQSGTRYRWTRRQFDEIVEAGVFDEDPHIELIEGEIIRKMTQKSRHATHIRLFDKGLRSVYGGEYLIQVQLPLALDPDSEPEPDIAVIKGEPRDFIEDHPTSALLVVEVADTSLAFDQGQKLQLYARHGISEYWILDVQAQRLEVYRDPSGDTYQTKATLRAGDTVTPPEASASLAVADILL